MSTSTADVVVTGLGATTPLGGDVASTWEALLAGRSGVSRITEDWVKDFPAQLVARLADGPGRPDRPRPGPPARPQPAGRAHRRPGGLGDSGAGDAGVDPRAPRRRRRHRHRRRADPARSGRRPRGEGPQAGLPLHHPDAHAQRPGRGRRPGDRRQGRRARPGQRLRVRRRGDPLGPGPAALRPRRRRPRRRHRGLRPPAADGRLRRDARDVHPQRRARARLAAVRQGPRRLRARRGRGRARARARRRRPGPRRQRSTPGSPVPASPPTATTWSRRTPRARAPRGRSPRRCATPG